MTNRAVRERLLASTIIAGAIAVAAPAFAQAPATTTPQCANPDASGNCTTTGATTTPSGPQTAESVGPAEPTATGDIVVTGSLIKNPSLVSSQPVQVLGQEEIGLRQTNTAEEILRDLPGAVADVGTAVNNGNGGFSFVNLRGLGSQRNLVLLDGNRVAPAELAGRTDLNNIPLALIQRTEVLTGGASTTYGADAISGVVNFITRNDFSGVEANVSKQITGQGDGAYYRADITIGANFDDGRGNVVLSVGYQHSDPVYQGDRKFSNSAIDSFSGAIGGSGTTVPSRFTGLTGGAKQIDPTTGALVPTYSLFNYNPYNVFQTPFERYNIYGAGHYDISDHLTIYTRGIFSRNTISTIIAPSGAFSTSVVIPYSNPYLPAAARSQFCANAAANGGTALTTAQCNAAALATSTTDPNYRTFTTTLARRAVEAGPRISNYTTNYFDYRAGIRGDITSNIHFDVNGSYGESQQYQSISGYTLTSHFKDALLATNTATCLSGNAGCVPVNVFGAAGSITPAMLSYLTATSSTITNTSLGQARAIVSGDFGVHSPFASDAINFAAGAEYRKYTAFFQADALAQGGDLGGGSGTLPTTHGAYDVTEGFGELIVPLVQDKPFMQALTVDGGIRYSHYSLGDSNATFNTTTWKGELTWQPVSLLKIRGGYQHAVRAPNIGELFTPTTVGLTSLSTDPCAGAAPTTNANLRAVCIAQGAPANLIGSIDGPSAGQVNGTTGGNVNLKPEKSNSYHAGVVIQPKQFVPGLSITADYYHINISGAISQPTGQDIINNCFSNPVAGSAACSLIVRNTTNGSLSGDGVTGLVLAESNLGTFLTSGIDLGANYRRDLGFAILNLSFEGNWTHKAQYQSTPTSLVHDCVGVYSASCGLNGGSIQPKFSWTQRTTLTYKGIDLSLLWRHIGAERQEPLDITDGNGPVCGSPGNTEAGCAGYDFGHIKAFNYLDLSTRFSAGEHVEFTLTVQNFLNKKPPIVGYDVGTSAFNSGNTYPSTYDALGRRFAMGAKLKF